MADQRSCEVFVLQELLHLLYLVACLIFIWHLNIFDVLIHIGQSQVTDHAHCLAFEGLFLLLLLTALLAGWSFEDDLSLLLELKELVAGQWLMLLAFLFAN